MKKRAWKAEEGLSKQQRVIVGITMEVDTDLEWIERIALMKRVRVYSTKTNEGGEIAMNYPSLHIPVCRATMSGSILPLRKTFDVLVVVPVLIFVGMNVFVRIQIHAIIAGHCYTLSAPCAPVPVLAPVLVMVGLLLLHSWRIISCALITNKRKKWKIDVINCPVAVHSAVLVSACGDPNVSFVVWMQGV